MEIAPYPLDPRYGATRCGRVFRLVAYGRCRKREMTRYLGKRGYLVVQLDKQWLTVHRIVAQTFMPNPNNLPVVAHRDGSKVGNNVDNLRWSTYAENTEDARQHGTLMLGDAHVTRILSEADVRYIKSLLAKPNRPRHVDIGDAYGVTRECIGRIAQGRNWRHV